jgi:hypothetical protein
MLPLAKHAVAGGDHWHRKREEPKGELGAGLEHREDPKTNCREGHVERERSARLALAVGAVACIGDQRRRGYLVARRAAWAATRKRHDDGGPSGYPAAGRATRANRSAPA